MSEITSIAKAIEMILRREFGERVIAGVYVEEALDRQGDCVLQVTAIFDQPDGLDPRKTVAAVRHIQDYVASVGLELPFPIISYISKADAAGLYPEAA